jgi:hypothetical protein
MSQFQKSADIRRNLAFSEDSISGHQEFRSRTNHISDRLRSYSAIDFYPEMVTIGVAHCDQLANLIERAGNEFLSAKTWVDGHDQYVVHHSQHFTQRVYRGCRIDDHSGLRALGANQVQSTVKMNTGFLVNADPICTGIDEGRYEVVRVLDHQVAVQGDIRHLADGRNHRRTDREVRDKMPVHHVQMEQGRSRCNRLIYLLAKTSKICRQNGRSQFDQTEPLAGSNCGNSSIVSGSAPLKLGLNHNKRVLLLSPHGVSLQLPFWICIQVDVPMLRRIPFVLLALLLALPAFATPKHLDLKKLLAQPPQKHKEFIPARAGWDGPEQVVKPNAYAERMELGTQDVGAAWIALLLPDWRIVLALGVLIIALRQLRKTTSIEQPASYQEPPADRLRAA